jgi:hypothetical protein
MVGDQWTRGDALEARRLQHPAHSVVSRQIRVDGRCHLATEEKKADELCLLGAGTGRREQRGTPGQASRGRLPVSGRRWRAVEECMQRRAAMACVSAFLDRKP